MEWYVVVLASLLCGTFCYFIGVRRQPKDKLWSGLRKDYEEAIEHLRKENKRLQSSFNFYKKGAVPQSVASEESPEAIIDAVISALPPNFKVMIGPFKKQAVEWAKENPELVQSGLEALKANFLKKGGQGQEVAVDSL